MARTNKVSKFGVIKKIVVLVFFIALIIFLSPFSIFLAGEKTQFYVFENFCYEKIAKRITRNCVDDSTKAHLLYKFVKDSIKNIDFSTTKIPETTFELLIYGYGYCDQKARLLINLCSKIGIEGRIVFINYQNGYSEHTIVELLINGRWKSYDPSQNFYGEVKHKKTAPVVEIENKAKLALTMFKIAEMLYGKIFSEIWIYVFKVKHNNFYRLIGI